MSAQQGLTHLELTRNQTSGVPSPQHHCCSLLLQPTPTCSCCPCCLLCCLAPVVLQDAKQMIETNFLSVVALTKEVVQGMMARNRGHIVNMSSIAGKEAYHGAGPLTSRHLQASC